MKRVTSNAKHALSAADLTRRHVYLSDKHEPVESKIRGAPCDITSVPRRQRWRAIQRRQPQPR